MNAKAALTGPIGVAIGFSIAFSVVLTPINHLLLGQPQMVVAMTSIGSGIAVGVTRWLVADDHRGISGSES